MTPSAGDRLLGLVHEVLVHLRRDARPQRFRQRLAQMAEKRGRGNQHDALEAILALRLYERLDDVLGEQLGLVPARRAFAADPMVRHGAASSHA